MHSNSLRTRAVVKFFLEYGKNNRQLSLRHYQAEGARRNARFVLEAKVTSRYGPFWSTATGSRQRQVWTMSAIP
jgi:hypothetical protein